MEKEKEIEQIVKIDPNNDSDMRLLVIELRNAVVWVLTKPANTYDPQKAASLVTTLQNEIREKNMKADLKREGRLKDENDAKIQRNLGAFFDLLDARVSGNYPSFLRFNESLKLGADYKIQVKTADGTETTPNKIEEITIRFSKEFFAEILGSYLLGLLDVATEPKRFAETLRNDYNGRAIKISYLATEIGQALHFDVFFTWKAT